LTGIGAILKFNLSGGADSALPLKRCGRGTGMGNTIRSSLPYSCLLKLREADITILICEPGDGHDSFPGWGTWNFRDKDIESMFWKQKENLWLVCSRNNQQSEEDGKKEEKKPPASGIPFKYRDDESNKAEINQGNEKQPNQPGESELPLAEKGCLYEQQVNRERKTKAAEDCQNP
jgi:hypothetical protein